MNTVDLAAERAAAVARMQRRLLDAYARPLLNEIGWGATRRQIQAAVRERFGDRSIRRQAAISRRARQIQATEQPDVRRIDPATVASRRIQKASNDMGKPILTPEQRDRVRVLIRERLEADPDASAVAVQGELEREGVAISYNNFCTNYWSPALRELGTARNGRGGKRGRPRKTRVAGPTKASTPAAAPAPASPAAPPAPAVLPPPAPILPEGLHLVPGLDGMARVQIDVRLPFSRALRALAAVAEEMGREVA